MKMSQTVSHADSTDILVLSDLKYVVEKNIWKEKYILPVKINIQLFQNFLP